MNVQAYIFVQADLFSCARKKSQVWESTTVIFLVDRLANKPYHEALVCEALLPCKHSIARRKECLLMLSLLQEHSERT
jgi:hypothetical protein